VNKKLIYFITILLAAILLFGFTKDSYFKINKSFDVFGAIFREVSANYVLEVDPELLIKGAIQGMLATLDPYTEFYDASDQEDLEILTSGTYTGFGISLSNIDSMITITEVRDGYSASLAGVRVGDRIFKIDDTEVLNQDYNDIKDFIKGTAGSKSTFLILRDGNPDTLKFELSRKQIQLDNISYYNMLDSNTGYIKIDRFNSTVANDFRFSLAELKRKNKLSSLVIDLRDNPGGLLDPAVQICELFLPIGSVVVNTKGRDGKDLYTYKSDTKPIEPDLPLVVMINENSASASEIIAGAMQDYDRAVIVGNRSYGKGLVQTILPIPYKGNLKITTAKYYTPSGRCIQRIKFAEQYQQKSLVQDSPDSNIYFTQKGRKVYESTGINPDTGSTRKVVTEIINDLYLKLMFFKFANYYTGNLNELPQNFKNDDKLFENFQKYLIKNNYVFQSEAEVLLKRLKEISEETKYSKNFDKGLQVIKKELENESLLLLSKSKEDVLRYLDFEIRVRFSTEKDMISRLLKIDTELELAKSVLRKDVYNRILSP
jgi:carboxyl-terminal processing protease